MSTGKMHADEVDTDSSLVRRLLAAQFPQWADLPIERVASSGTDNALYRLGDTLVARMPRIHWAQDQTEAQWLPHLAPHLPLAIPTTLAVGEPGEGYPWKWSVCRWLEGESAESGRFSDPSQAARDLAGFITALRRIDPTGGPLPEPGQRGSPLATRDEGVRESLAELAALPGALDPADLADAAAAWEADVRAPVWEGAPVWIHGDLLPGNLLIHRGRLSAVIDFGSMGIGDPACDLQPAWCVFSGAAREAFRDALEVDDAAWARGRGWALSVALIALPYYLHTSPEITERSRSTIAEVLADYRRGH